MAKKITLDFAFDTGPGPVRIKSTTRKGQIVVDTDSKHLSPLVEFFLGELQTEILNIKTRPKKSTIARRRRAGVSGDRLFVATHRLINGMDAVTDGETWVIKPPRDRLRIPEIRQRFIKEIDMRKISKRTNKALQRSVLRMIGRE